MPGRCVQGLAACGCGPERPEVWRCVPSWSSRGYMCVALAVAAAGARCSGQAVCVVPGRRGFGRELAHGSAIAGERQLGAACWEPFGWVEWFGTAPREGRPRESPRNSSRTGSPRNSTRSSSAAAGAIVNQSGAPSRAEKSLHLGFFAKPKQKTYAFSLSEDLRVLSSASAGSAPPSPGLMFSGGSAVLFSTPLSGLAALETLLNASAGVPCPALESGRA